MLLLFKITIAAFYWGIFIGGIAAGVIVYLSIKKQRSDKQNGAHCENEGVFTMQMLKKQENKEKILNLLNAQNKVTNDDVEKLLDVSNTTAERYLDQLEKQGKIKQIGKTGRHVYYKRA